mgnify:CR=1 FL=1
MKASDTVMGRERMLEIRKHVFADNPGTIVTIQENTAMEQAEISFKAGMREVIEWVKNNITIPYPVGSVGYKRWQSQLKKWGDG